MHALPLHPLSLQMQELKHVFVFDILSPPIRTHHPMVQGVPLCPATRGVIVRVVSPKVAGFAHLLNMCSRRHFLIFHTRRIYFFVYFQSRPQNSAILSECSSSSSGSILACDSGWGLFYPSVDLKSCSSRGCGCSIVHRSDSAGKALKNKMSVL